MPDPRREAGDLSEGTGPQESARAAESVAFAPTRVGAVHRRASTPLVGVAWLIVLGTVVGIGLVSPAGTDPVATTAPDGRVAPAAHASVAHLPASTPTVRSPGLPRPVPGPSDAPNLIAVSVKPVAGGVAVTGTVLSDAVVWVFVSVQDASGNVETWRSISSEDPAFRPDHRPSFTMQLLVSPQPGGQRVWIEANAYNAIGRKVGSVRQPFSVG